MDGNKGGAMAGRGFTYDGYDNHNIYTTSPPPPYAYGPVATPSAPVDSYDHYNSYTPSALPYSQVPVITPPASVHQTTVVVNQATPQLAPAVRRTWSTSLWGCCDDVGICLCVSFLTYCASSKLAQDMGENCCLPLCFPGWMVALRTKLRMQLNIQGSVCDDCMVTACCGLCALCQLMREVDLARRTGQLQ